MAGKIDRCRAMLREMADRGEPWEPFLLQESGLPGPRGNLELVAAVADEGSADFFHALVAEPVPEAESANTQDEFLVVCGLVGLGRLLGYCWSVAVAALPGPGKAAMERWFGIEDLDVHWVMAENLKKKRLVRMDAEWVADGAGALTPTQADSPEKASRASVGIARACPVGVPLVRLDQEVP